MDFDFDLIYGPKYNVLPRISDFTGCTQCENTNHLQIMLG